MPRKQVKRKRRNLRVPDPRGMTIAEYIRLVTAIASGEPSIDDPESFAYDILNALGVTANPPYLTPKWWTALNILCQKPSEYFHEESEAMNTRDRNLIYNKNLPFCVTLGEKSYLKQIHHKLFGKDQIKTTPWTSKKEQACRVIVAKGSAGFVGYEKPPIAPDKKWEEQIVDVQIMGKLARGVTSGVLIGKPSNMRILAGPMWTCPSHPWDAMILQDAVTESPELKNIPSIASRKYDILLMKMCEDYEYPWVVVGLSDSGERIQKTDSPNLQA